MSSQNNALEDNSSNRSLNSETLFEDTYSYSLSELDLDILNYRFFDAAETLVGLHKVGLVHGDLHKGNLLVKPNGVLEYLDFEKSQQVNLDPALMFKDLVIPYVDFQPNEFLAFFAGYVHNPEHAAH